MTNPEPQDATIHTALAAAALEPKRNQNGTPMTPCSVRMHERTKAIAQEICARHGTDLSGFLRKCAEALLVDYGIETEPTE